MSINSGAVATGSHRAASPDISQSFLFRSPHDGWLWADGLEDVSDRVWASTPSGLAGQVQRLLDARQGEQQAPCLVGALPFQGMASARLFLPGRMIRDASSIPMPLPQDLRWPAPRSAGRSLPAEDGYCARVAAALDEIAAGQYSKVVLARALTLEFDAPVPVAGMIAALAERYPQAFLFAVPQANRQGVFLGASPELLLRRCNGWVDSNPLAGSVPCHPQAAEDRAQAEALLASDKNRREHALVSERVADVLSGYCDQLSVPDEPSLIRTGTLWHLSTAIRGRLRDPSVSSVELAAALHPTPAVCGHPTGAARQAISRLEGFDRGLYAGMVGWCDHTGDGEWAVSLRCADLAGAFLTLYAGAGIVAGSDPVEELAETATKMRTVLGALGLTLRAEAA